MKFFAILMLILSFLASFFGPIDSPTGEVTNPPTEIIDLIAGSVCYSDSECLSNSCTDKNLYDGIDKKTCD